LYLGRGSGTPSLDIFITLLGLGAAGFKTLLATRKNNFLLLQERMERIAERFGLHLLKTKVSTLTQSSKGG